MHEMDDCLLAWNMHHSWVPTSLVHASLSQLVVVVHWLTFTLWSTNIPVDRQMPWDKALKVRTAKHRQKSDYAAWQVNRWRTKAIAKFKDELKILRFKLWIMNCISSVVGYTSRRFCHSLARWDTKFHFFFRVFCICSQFPTPNERNNKISSQISQDPLLNPTPDIMWPRQIPHLDITKLLICIKFWYITLKIYTKALCKNLY